MSFRVIPVRLPAVEVHIHADRRLAFQVAAAFSAGGTDPHAPKVLEEGADGRLKVEFHSLTPTITGGHKRHRTVEWVTLHEPAAVEFQGLEGPLDLLSDRFTFEDVNGCTRFRYESTIGVTGWWAGWLVSTLYVRPLLRRFMREHTAELKETIEARAARSRLYPQVACAIDTAVPG